MGCSTWKVNSFISEEVWQMLTVHEVNENNRRFWEEENAARDRRIANEDFRVTAFARLSDEQARRVLLKSKAHPAVPGWSICSMRVPCAGDQRRAGGDMGWLGRDR